MTGAPAQLAEELAEVTAALDALLERQPPLSPAVRRMVAQWRGVAAFSRGCAKPAPARPPPDGDPLDLDHIV
jgi:hypothetical protein